MNKKISFPIAITIIAVCAVLVGGFFLYRYWRDIEVEKEPVEIIILEHETADWETYKNELFGCEIKYPRDWIIKEASHLVIFFPEQELEKNIFLLTHKLTLEEETKCIPLFYEEIKLRIERKEIINGTEFCKMYYEYEEGVTEIFYEPIKGNNKIGDIGDVVCDIGFSYQGSLSEKKNEARLTILRQMLSTFRFLE